MKTLFVSYIAGLLALAPSHLSAAGKLGEGMRESGWDRILGTWVDAETKGEKLSISYGWRFKDTLIESTTRWGETRNVAMIGLNGKTDKVFLMSADNKGGSSTGSFTGNDDGSATLGVQFVTSDGNEGTLSINYRFEDNDTLVVTIEAEKPTVLRLIRSTDKDQSEKGGGDSAEKPAESL